LSGKIVLDGRKPVGETFPDPIEHATGEEKIMLILKEKGIDVSVFP
jgi:hypothetical protein